MTLANLLTPHLKDLGGGFMVRRLLPAAQRQSVGPFVFMDHFGPVTQPPGSDADVRPHPHIGLSTVSYLFEGAMIHRDSLGSVQRIEPGAINWMTAGRGIVHSERTPEDLRAVARKMHGLQLWAALPRDREEIEPEFVHTPAAAIPQRETSDYRCRVLIGEAFGLRSPVRTYSDTLYLDVEMRAHGKMVLEAFAEERAVYSVDNALRLGGEDVAPTQLAVLPAGMAVSIRADAGARFVVIGGAPTDGRRHMWWNFVSSRKERIETAKADWVAQRMGTIPGETEFIPLP